jgi:hypothetical protein
MIHFGAKSKTLKGPTIRINCPFCHARDVLAETGELAETTTIMLIPVSTSHATLAKCGNCSAVLVSKLPVSELTSRTPEELEGVLRVRPNFIGGFMAVSAFVLSFYPVIGLLWSGLGILANRRSRRWIRILSWVSLGISVGMSIFYTFLLLHYR